MLGRRDANAIIEAAVSADVVAGGFPCQDISLAGTGTGIAGPRSGLWGEMVRAIRLVRPKYAIVENVAALLGRGLDKVLGDLAQIGYDAEWDCLPAAAFGAPHRRDRIWIVAHAEGEQVGGTRQSRTAVPTDTQSQHRRRGPCQQTDGKESQSNHPGITPNAEAMFRAALLREQQDRAIRCHWNEPWRQRLSDIRRMDDGLPNSVDRLRALGNAVVPQVVEMIGHAIMEVET